jgi:hypothetical protein
MFAQHVVGERQTVSRTRARICEARIATISVTSASAINEQFPAFVP